MAFLNNIKDKVLTGLIIGVSILGILYFGFISVEKNTNPSKENPFRYPIEKYELVPDKLNEDYETIVLKTTLPEINSLAVGPGDKIFVSGSSQVLVFNPDLSLNQKINTVKDVHCISVFNKRIYLGVKDHVEVYSTKGDIIGKWEPAAPDTYITSIAASEDSVFVADAENRIVWEYSITGQKIRPIGKKDEAKEISGFVIPSYYFDLAIDPDGFLWVVNPGRHSLENYTPEATIRTSWGKYSSKIDGFCGCCNPIHFAIRQDGFFITAEKGIPRIKIYNRLGELDAVVAGPDKFDEGTKIKDLAVNSLGHIFIPDSKSSSIRILKKTLKKEKGI